MATSSSPVNVFVKRLHPDAVIPTRQTAGSSGYDICALEDTLIHTHGTPVLIRTGIAFEIPQGYEGVIRPRSGKSTKGLPAILGTIDADYRGEVSVIMQHAHFGHFHAAGEGRPFKISKGERVAQIVFQAVPDVKLIEVNELSDTSRGARGFGHTG